MALLYMLDSLTMVVTGSLPYTKETAKMKGSEDTESSLGEFYY